MATIRTTLALYDGVTGPLKAMCRGMNSLINVMESAKGSFSDAFDPTVLQQIREDLAEATVGFDQMEQNIRQADKAQSKFNNTIQEGSSAAGGMLSQIKKIAVAVGGLATVKKLVDLSDDLSSTKARLNLIVDDGGSVAELEKKIMASAQRSRASYLTTAKAISQMGLMAGDAFANNDELIAFTETLNKAFVNVGAGTQQIEAATLQLTQAMASGVLRGEELNSVFENAQPVIQAIADYLGEPIGKIRTLAAEGKITADIIAGAFAVLGAFLINTFIVPAQNGFARFANFIGNVFNNPIAAVEVAFYDMFLTVLGYISKLAHAIEDVINKIPGVTVDITSGLDNFYAGIEKAQQKVKDESGWVEYVKKMDFIDYSDAASAGYKFGEGIADKVSGFFGGGLDSIDAFNMGNAWDGIYGNTADTAANTAATAEALDIAEEDLAYLRDIAEREAINRFTTAEIKVEQHNENHISKDADLDGIMDAWANDFAEKLEVSEEGVHE